MTTKPTIKKKRRYTTRDLRIGDIPALLDLERKQWTQEQQATAEDFRARIAAHPDLSGGAFCVDTGELLASVFGKPTTAVEWVNPGDWKKSAALDGKVSKSKNPSRCLFGISLTSVDAGAALQLIAFQYLYAVKCGDREVFLGSPMPGLKRHLQQKPDASVEAYARATRSGLPVDPQLRYYHGKGFCEIVAVRENYFPHEASCDYGAILRSKVPYPWLTPLFRLIPVPVLRSLAALAPRYAIPEDGVTPDPVEPAAVPEAA
ncbi:MAG: hypothetical protein V4858_04230 [Pseudomonadota bacterium]